MSVREKAAWTEGGTEQLTENRTACALAPSWASAHLRASVPAQAQDVLGFYWFTSICFISPGSLRPPFSHHTFYAVFCTSCYKGFLEEIPKHVGHADTRMSVHIMIFHHPMPQFFFLLWWNTDHIKIWVCLSWCSSLEFSRAVLICTSWTPISLPQISSLLL